MNDEEPQAHVVMQARGFLVLGEQIPLISTRVDRTNPRALGDVSSLGDAHTYTHMVWEDCRAD